MSEATQSETLGKLATAVAKVIAATGYVQTDANNTQQGYRFLSDEALLMHLRGDMAKQGLSLIPKAIAYELGEKKTRSGGAMMLITTVFTFVLIHTSGEWMNVSAIAQGTDSLDKAPYKAATGALKYALRQTFLVPTGDDPEKDHPAVQQKENTAHLDLCRAVSADWSQRYAGHVDDYCHAKNWPTLDQWTTEKLGNFHTAIKAEQIDAPRVKA